MTSAVSGILKKNKKKTKANNESMCMDGSYLTIKIVAHMGGGATFKLFTICLNYTEI